MLARLLLAAGLTVAVAAPASGATITHNIQVDLPPNGSSAFFVFPQFDPALGTLTGYAGQMTAEYRLAASWEVPPPPAELGYSGFVVLYLHLRDISWSAAGPMLGIHTPVVGSQMLFAGDAGSYDSGVQHLEGDVRSYGQDDIYHHPMAIIGPGTQQGSILYDFQSWRECNLNFPGACASGFEFSSYLTVNLQLTYTYEVPEPSTWAHLIMGFGGTGVALRRRSSRPQR